MTNETNKLMVGLCDKVIASLKCNYTGLCDDGLLWDINNLVKLRSLIEGEGKMEVVAYESCLPECPKCRHKVFRDLEYFACIKCGQKLIWPTEDEKKEEVKIELLKASEGSVTGEKN